MTEFSYQLYSSRNFGPIGDTLRNLADLGYAAVEGYGGLITSTADVEALRRGLDDSTLTMPSCHIGLDEIEADADNILSIAQTLGIKNIFVPYLGEDQRPTDAAGWAAFAQRLAAATTPLRGAGLNVGWHNHDFEFTALPDGTLPIDAMLDAAPELAFEFDVAWAVVAGADPIDTITKYGPRILAAHVKDRAPEGKTTEDGWADVGDGVIDWASLLTALRGAGTTLFVMEHDNPSDDMRFARTSLGHAQTL